MGSTTLYADRAFVTVNGYEWQDLKTARIKRNPNVKRVGTMARNYRNAGYKYGNLDVDVDVTFEIQQLQATFDLYLQDPTQEVDLVFEVGGDRYTVKNVVESNMESEGSVGDASKSSSYMALDITNENGISVNAVLQLG
jgi:hypothetical protein